MRNQEIAMKSNRAVAMTVMTSVAFATGAAYALSEHATAKEAETMVKKGVTYIKVRGKEQGYAEITSKQSQFRDRDLYLVVYGLDGKEFVRERTELAKTKNSFWQNYKFTNPVDRKVEPKSMYCERLDETVVCGGIYKPE